jgi:hypothetical protein
MMNRAVALWSLEDEMCMMNRAVSWWSLDDECA